MLVQNLPEEAEVWVGQAGTQGWGMKAVGLNGTTDGIRMDAKFSGNGSDFPMLGVEVTANLRTGFRANHLSFIVLILGFWGTDR
jgi:hypothetical protein